MANQFIFWAGLLITVLTAVPVVLMMRNQPKGLFVCFFAEMWERFSYYGMRALLVFYMTQHFLFDDKRANSQYGSYATLVYMLPLIGGLVADRWIGTRKAVIFGGALLVLGHMGMAWEYPNNREVLIYHGQTYEFVSQGREADQVVKLRVGSHDYAYEPGKDGGFVFKDMPANSPVPSVLPKGSFEKKVIQSNDLSEPFFFASISLIIMGVGFLKPNISALVGQLYKQHDPRRDAGFQLYYFGINMGSFWAALVCGTLGRTYGWNWGFGAAGIGMLIGLLWFILGKPWLEGKGEAPDGEALAKPRFAGLNLQTLIYLGGVLGVVIIYFLVQLNKVVGYCLGAASLIFIGYVVFNMITRFSRVENFRLGLAMILSASSVIFWGLFEQAGSSLSLFSERNTNLDILNTPVIFDVFGKTVVLATQVQLSHLAGGIKDYFWVNMDFSASNTQSFNPFFILVFAPLIGAFFTFLSKRGLDPDPVKKFAFALVNVGLGFLLLVFAAKYADASFKVPMIFLLGTYFFHTLGELTLSPVGLSQQTKLSPPLVVSTMMAIWFLGTSGGQYLAGWIAGLASSETVGGKVLDAHAALQTSLHTFNQIGWAGVGLGALLFVISFFVKNWSHGANDYEH